MKNPGRQIWILYRRVAECWILVQSRLPGDKIACWIDAVDRTILSIPQRRGTIMMDGPRHNNNTYCAVLRMANGKIEEVTEYLDTALVKSTLEAPSPSA